MTSSKGRADRSAEDPHGWNAVDNYLKVHERRLDDLFHAGELIDSSLSYEWAEDQRSLAIEGRLTCPNGLFVDVHKTLEVNEQLQVRTIRYSYHAGRTNPERTVFRYDNRHVHENHPDEHHRHRYDYATWEQIKPAVWIGKDRWPHLSDVVRELIDWWTTTGQFLPP